MFSWWFSFTGYLPYAVNTKAEANKPPTLYLPHKISTTT